MSDDEVFTIREWCTKAKISEPTFFKEKKLGRGPKTSNVGRRVVVTESPREFYARKAAGNAA